MIGRCVTGLLCMLIISVSSGTVYVQSGSDITDCNMKCPQDDVTLELFRQCKGEDRTLLENLCYFNHTKSHDSRLRLHTGSGCWKLTSARKDDTCVYKVWCYCDKQYLMSSTEIRVLDPVLISNISSNGSRLGEEMAVSVQFSGEESAVTWEVDGEPLPERYRLIDDNRTLIIPSVQRDDTERRIRVRITNPVSEEIREYRLISDTMFIRRLETEDSDSHRGRPGLIVGVSVEVVMVMISIIWIHSRRKKKAIQTKHMHKNGAVPTMENGAVPTMGNGAVPTMGNGAVPTMENGAVPTMENGDVYTMGNGAVPTMGNGAVPIMGNGAVPTMGNGDVYTMANGAVPTMGNGDVYTMGNGAVPTMNNRKVYTIRNGAVPIMGNGAMYTVDNEAATIMGNGAVPTMENKAVYIIEQG